MENNEIMNNEEIEVMEEPIVENDGSLGTGMAMLIGAGLAFAIGGAVKLGKKIYAKAKAKKDQRYSDKGIIINPECYEDAES